MNSKRETNIHTCEKVSSNYSIVASASATIPSQLLSMLNTSIPWTPTYFLSAQEKEEEEEGDKKQKVVRRWKV
jgi:hypothetical protein